METPITKQQIENLERLLLSPQLANAQVALTLLDENPNWRVALQTPLELLFFFVLYEPGMMYVTDLEDCQVFVEDDNLTVYAYAKVENWLVDFHADRFFFTSHPLAQLGAYHFKPYNALDVDNLELEEEEEAELPALPSIDELEKQVKALAMYESYWPKYPVWAQAFTSKIQALESLLTDHTNKKQESPLSKELLERYRAVLWYYYQQILGLATTPLSFYSAAACLLRQYVPPNLSPTQCNQLIKTYFEQAYQPHATNADYSLCMVNEFALFCYEVEHNPQKALAICRQEYPKIIDMKELTNWPQLEQAAQTAHQPTAFKRCLDAVNMDFMIYKTKELVEHAQEMMDFFDNNSPV